MSQREVDGAEIAGSPKVYTKKELQLFLADIGKRVLEPNSSYLHSVLAMNHLLRQANLPELLDTDTREQMKDLWIKLKSTGMQLNDPPLLFGTEAAAVPAVEGNPELAAPKKPAAAK